MADLLWLVAITLSAALLVAATWAAVVGGLGALTGARFERCSRCGRHGLIRRGQLHPGGCPPARYAVWLAHVWHDGHTAYISRTTRPDRHRPW